MNSKKLNYVLGAGLVLASTIAVVAAQHRAAGPQADAGSLGHLQFLHACNPAGDTAASSHVPAHLSQMLALTEAQSKEIDRIAAEACAAMTRAHEQIAGVLTAEQRDKIRQLHADSSHGALAGFFKKLHGK